MNAKLLLCLAALPAAVDALGEFHAEEVKTTCPTLVPLRLNQTNTAGSLMNTGTLNTHTRPRLCHLLSRSQSFLRVCEARGLSGQVTNGWLHHVAARVGAVC